MWSWLGWRSTVFLGIFCLFCGKHALASEPQKPTTLPSVTSQEEKLRKEAAANAEKLAGVVIKIGAKAGENGKIFGSVTTIQVAEALNKAGYPVERKNIEISEESIKALGTYNAKVRLFKDVTASISFEVVAE